MKNSGKIINFDTQGWPLYELSLKDIVETICTFDKETNRYYINADDDVLKIVPRIFEDDGMGYGVNEKRITEFSIDKDYKEQYSNIFVEKPIKNIDLWMNSDFFPNCYVKKGRTRYIARDIRKNEEGEFEFLCERIRKDESVWINGKKLKFDE